MFYQSIPMEMDANAAAAMFVRARFGEERINELLKVGNSDAGAFRSLVPPETLATLPERMIAFLAAMPGLCRGLAAQRGSVPFERVLDAHWQGAGEVWRQYVEGVRLPRR